jgi:hypothetical protein
MFFGTYYQSTVFALRRDQTQNDLGQVVNGCLYRITGTMHIDYVWRTSTLVSGIWSVSVYGELKWLSRGTLHQAGLLSRATASNSCRKNIGLRNCLRTAPYTERRGILHSSSQWDLFLDKNLWHILDLILVAEFIKTMHKDIKGKKEFYKNSKFSRRRSTSACCNIFNRTY